MRTKRDDIFNRSAVIVIRVRPDEKEDIQRAAGSGYGRVSEWLRGLALREFARRRKEIERAEADREKAARRRRKRGKR